ncbi:hypothetical protein GIS00_18220 [Nakamurella sp. YIM 132087]|uniref:DUF6802 domain-containing protein n=1 Tax=Nakamurella alba TaxID=2665158 RepID=A0A7K1FSQ9_9ACTN|nr:DUF6802 family protein [Nakamurella alba]MTD15874.1 hypothetical protein [Nakamurella alba]
MFTDGDISQDDADDQVHTGFVADDPIDDGTDHTGVDLSTADSEGLGGSPDTSSPEAEDPAGTTADPSDPWPHPGYNEEGELESTDPGTEDPVTPEGGADPATGDDLVMVGADGSEVSLGEPNVTFAGEYDAVAVEAEDGSVEVYADADHNGTVDVAISIQPDGSFGIWVSDGAGGWDLQATGVVDSSGEAQIDDTVDTGFADTPPSAIAGDAAGTTDPVGTTDPAGAAGTDEPTAAQEYPGVVPGDLAVADGDEYIDAGPPTEDMDGDGVPETAVVQSDDRIIQISDIDGDGRADEMLQVDTTTNEAVILTDDGSGTWTVAAQGTIGEDGDFVPADGTTGTVQEAGTSDPADSPEIVFTDASGEQTDLGVPDQDLDGDGVPESVLAQAEDGSYLIVSDVDADGGPDQIIQIDPDSGDATWAVPDGDGGWEVVATGHLESDGNLVMDAEPQSAVQPAGHTTEQSQGSVMVSSSGGQFFDAGEATLDADGDGVADTVQVPGPNDSTLFYQDSDGDGVADKAWTTDSSGEVTATYVLDAQGSWTPGSGIGAGSQS